MRWLVFITLLAFPHVNVSSKLTMRDVASEHYNRFSYDVPAEDRSDGEALKNLKTACERAKASFCLPYTKTKEYLEKQVKELEKEIPKEMAFLAGVALKVLYEGKVKFEFKTAMGRPSFSISDEETNINWSFSYNF